MGGHLGSRSVLDLLVLCRKTEAAVQIEILALRHSSASRLTNQIISAGQRRAHSAVGAG